MSWLALRWDDPPHPVVVKGPRGRYFTVGFMRLDEAYYYCAKERIPMFWPNGRMAKSMPLRTPGLSGILLELDWAEVYKKRRIRQMLLRKSVLKE